MRESEKPASLAELMGEDFSSTHLTMEDLPKLLGEKMPEIRYDRVGKIRLINALHQRFGPGYANIPGIKSLLDDFNKELQTATVVRMNRRRK